MSVTAVGELKENTNDKNLLDFSSYQTDIKKEGKSYKIIIRI